MIEVIRPGSFVVPTRSNRNDAWLEVLGTILAERFGIVLDEGEQLAWTTRSRQLMIVRVAAGRRNIGRAPARAVEVFTIDTYAACRDDGRWAVMGRKGERLAVRLVREDCLMVQATA